MKQFQFANPEFLYGLIFIPILALLFFLAWQYKKKALRSYGDLKIIADLMPESSIFRQYFKFGLVLFALTMIILALARPQFGSKLQEVKRRGVEIIIALDVSNSMLAADLKPNRLENAKQSISKLLDNLKDDKVGLIVFAGDAYVQVPITTDYTSSKMFLSTVKTDYVQNQGTAIGAAIDLASKSFSPENQKNRAIIIITDGENHEDDAVSAAKEAKGKGISIFTIGMGLAQGAPIPENENGDFKRDNQGNVIVTKLDENMLQKIASAGNGMYIRASNSNSGLKNIYDEIDKMEKQELSSKVFSEYDDQFQYLIFFAFLALLIDFMLLERRNRYLKKIDFFN